MPYPGRLREIDCTAGWIKRRRVVEMAPPLILDTAVNGRAKRPRVRIRAARVLLVSREQKQERGVTTGAEDRNGICRRAIAQGCVENQRFKAVGNV